MEPVSVQSESVTDRLAYSLSEACEALGLSRSTIYRLVKAGKLDQAYCGGKALFLREELMISPRPSLNLGAAVTYKGDATSILVCSVLVAGAMGLSLTSRWHGQALH
jgi:excisionase family DNA binding protein